MYAEQESWDKLATALEEVAKFYPEIKENEIWKRLVELDVIADDKEITNV
jgi:hypothetical protein